MAVPAFISYLSLEKNYSDHTVLAYKTDLNEFLAFCVANYEDKDIGRVDYVVIRSWVVHLSETGISNRSINRKIAALKAYFRFLQKIGDIELNPLGKHKALKTSKKMEIPFSESEMEAVLSKVVYEDDFEGKRDQLMIQLLYATGMRRAELIHLKKTDIDFESNCIKVLGKRRKERLIPMLSGLKPLFLAYYKERDTLEHAHKTKYVFVSKQGNKVYETLVYRIVGKYFAQVSSKVKQSPHMLRHTFATHLLNKGADLNSVKELLGHASLASTQVYTHNSIAELKKVHALAHPRSIK